MAGVPSLAEGSTDRDSLAGEGGGPWRVGCFRRRGGFLDSGALAASCRCVGSFFGEACGEGLLVAAVGTTGAVLGLGWGDGSMGASSLPRALRI